MILGNYYQFMFLYLWHWNSLTISRINGTGSIEFTAEMVNDCSRRAIANCDSMKNTRVNSNSVLIPLKRHPPGGR